MVEKEFTELIEEELTELNRLINTNKDLIKKYPDDFGLKLNLYSLENRQRQIKTELITIRYMNLGS